MKEKNVTENDSSVWLAFLFSLAAENRKRKRTERQIELWALFASHIFIQNDKATSVDSCSVFFFLSRSLFLSFFSLYFYVLYNYRAKAYSTGKVCRCVFPQTKQKEKEIVQKNRKRRSVVIVVLVVSPSFLISRVNSHCVQQKRRRRKNERRRTMLAIDGWMDGWINVRTKKTSTPSPTHTFRKRREEKGEEQNACQNHKQ